MFRKCIACSMSFLLLAGCATQKVCFTSIPVGASVQAGKKKGITPCTLKVPKDIDHAVFALPSGEQIEVPVNGLDSGIEQASHGMAKVGGAVLMGAGGVAVVAGLGALSLYSCLMDDEPEWYDGEVGKDPHGNEDVLVFGLLATAGGGAAYVLGEWIYPDEAVPEIHADFPSVGTNGVARDSYYEDVGFGARRLKTINP